MISSKVIEVLNPLFSIVTNAKGETIGQIKESFFIGDKCRMKKGASRLIVENLLGIGNNNRDETDLSQIGREIYLTFWVVCLAKVNGVPEQQDD